MDEFVVKARETVISEFTVHARTAEEAMELAALANTEKMDRTILETVDWEVLTAEPFKEWEQKFLAKP